MYASVVAGFVFKSGGVIFLHFKVHKLINSSTVMFPARVMVPDPLGVNPDVEGVISHIFCQHDCLET